MKSWKKRKVRRTAFILINIAVPLAIILSLWTYVMEGNAHCAPQYPMEDITPYLNKKVLTDDEYDFLCWQTGLSKGAIDTLREENWEDAMLAVQKRYFEEVEITCECDLFMFREVIKLSEEPDYDWQQAFPVLEDGDILITFNSHFLGWRNGHAAIVVDAERGRTLEALTMGQNSTLLSVDNWMKRPSFVVLRLKGATEEVRAEIAEYAEENLAGLPYRLTAGMRGETENVTGTHCSHLIWSAYQKFGYDLDSDGGRIVTPKDIYDSPLLEVVQAYGI